MQLPDKGRDRFMGIAVVLAIAIPFGFCYAGHVAGPMFDVPASQLSLDRGSLWFPIPECDDAYLEVVSGEVTAQGMLVETAYIRDQRIGLFELNREIRPGGQIRIGTFFRNPSGRMLQDAGPLSAMLSRVLTGYSAPAARLPLLGAAAGTVERASNLADCAAAYPDILMVCGDDVWTSGYVDSLALMWAARMNLNVAGTFNCDLNLVHDGVGSLLGVNDLTFQLLDGDFDGILDPEECMDGMSGAVIIINEGSGAYATLCGNGSYSGYYFRTCDVGPGDPSYMYDDVHFDMELWLDECGMGTDETTWGAVKALFR